MENVHLGVDTAIPCGLIVNELVANAFKHGFPNGGPGTLTLLLRHTAPGRLEMIVEDDGRGIPPGVDLARTESLGMQLVYTLVQQLRGSIAVDSHPGCGTRFRLELQEIVTQQSHLITS